MVVVVMGGVLSRSGVLGLERDEFESANLGSRVFRMESVEWGIGMGPVEWEVLARPADSDM